MSMIVTVFIRVFRPHARASSGLTTMDLAEALLGEGWWLLGKGWSYDVPFRVDQPWGQPWLDLEVGCRNGYGEAPERLWALLDRLEPPAEPLWVRFNDGGGAPDTLERWYGDEAALSRPCLYGCDSVRVVPRPGSAPPGEGWRATRAGLTLEGEWTYEALNSRVRLGAPVATIDGLEPGAPMSPLVTLADGFPLKDRVGRALLDWAGEGAQRLQLLHQGRVTAHFDRSEDPTFPWHHWQLDGWANCLDGDFRAALEACDRPGAGT